MATKLLIVDDNKADRQAAIKKLSHYECVVTEVEDAAKLLPTALSEKPAVILLEVGFNTNEGLDLLRILKSNDQAKGIPIIVLSNRNTRDMVVQAAKLGVRDFVLKPVETAPLIERINRIVPMARKIKAKEDGVCILVVDDKPKITEQIQASIEGTGWELVCVTCNSEAMTFLEDKEADVILVSLSLPNEDGFRLLRSIRSSETLKDIPTFAMCVRTAVEEQSRAQHSGATGLITKPFDKDDLRHKLHRALNLDTSQRFFSIRDNILFVTFPATVETMHTEFITDIKPQTAAMVDAGLSRIVLDLTQVGGMDTDVIKVVIQIMEYCSELGVRYCVVGTSHTAAKAKVFEETKNMQIYESVEEAIKVLE